MESTEDELARINIEDQFWLDIIDVISEYGSHDLAIGNAIRFIRFAQEKHRHGLLISEDEFIQKGFNEALFPLFAERTDCGIRARGSGKYFDWLVDKSEAGRIGGKKSAERPRDASGRLQAKVQADSKQTQADPSKHPSNIQAEPSKRDSLDKTVQAPKHSQASPSPSYSNKKEDLTEYTTHVVEEGGTGETAATEKPNHPRQRFKIHPALADDSINDVLATIADTTQKRWVGVYGDPDWTKKALKEAISFYTARGDDLSGGWGVVLHKALDRASRARINANGGRSSDLSHNDPKFWAKVFAQEAK